ncbi:pilus assembly protein PilM [Natranaerobius trueperi]|nr:pilus assembly protein PilM [Natranaerobius trueperi]
MGLELKDDKMRAVELHKKRNTINIVNVRERDLAAGIIENGKIQDCNKLVKELENFWSNSGFSSKDVNLGISNQDIIVRFASFPKISEKKLDNAVKFQAQNMLPININQLVLDYTVIGETHNEDENPIWEVLMVGGKIDMIYDYIYCLEKAELFINDIEILPLSMGRLLEKEQQERVVIIIDSTGGVINLSVFEHGNPKLARMITPSDTTTEMSSPYDEIAASIDINPGGRNDELLGEAQINQVVTNTRTLIDYYQTQNTAKYVDAILICGGAKNYQMLMDRLENFLGLPVYFSNPQTALGVEATDLSLEEIKYYSQVISLAYKGMEEN